MRTGRTPQVVAGGPAGPANMCYLPFHDQPMRCRSEACKAAQPATASACPNLAKLTTPSDPQLDAQLAVSSWACDQLAEISRTTLIAGTPAGILERGARPTTAA